MIENKEKIAEALGKVFAMTREDIARAEYLDDSANGGEVVVLYNSKDEVLLEVSVHWDSGCALIFDVAKAVQFQLL
ncbi:MAG: hypothetical protein K6C05_07310 [Anaerovibrio sp.]|uniref:hypothetical protein n=1 Tax=Anaerovibrio sp. TaxID=1872532 RepID=UPI0025CBC4B4|nr:hypothetical protein [Anaerovibrio sp.]MCR5176646.1 hypothetical protein [Anaerovibrio sp.]